MLIRSELCPRRIKQPIGATWQAQKRSEARKQISELDALVETVYERSVAAHGDLGLTLEAFAAHLKQIIAQHHLVAIDKDAIQKIGASAHTEDLYLAAACAQKSDAAWDRFAALYENHINKLNGKYKHAITDSLSAAVASLSARERLVLVLILTQIAHHWPNFKREHEPRL